MSQDSTLEAFGATDVGWSGPVRDPELADVARAIVVGLGRNSPDRLSAAWVIADYALGLVPHLADYRMGIRRKVFSETLYSLSERLPIDLGGRRRSDMASPVGSLAHRLAAVAPQELDLVAGYLLDHRNVHESAWPRVQTILYEVARPAERVIA